MNWGIWKQSLYIEDLPPEGGSHPEDSERVVGAEGGRNLRFRELGGEILAGVDEAVRFELVLLVVQRAIPSPQRQELLVGAALDDLAVLEDENLVCTADRR